jgi:hypothetical protein
MSNNETEFEASGYRCKVVLYEDSIGQMKWFCGYVGLPKSHPAAGKDYDDIEVDVHGGLTFAKEGNDKDARWPDNNLYWVGFDCAHAGDYTGSMFGYSEIRERHWTLEDVKAETEKLAAQLKRLSK